MKNTTLTLTLLLFNALCFGQWTNQTDVNTLVADSETGDVQSIGTSDGKTYIAFWKNVPDPVNYEMRLQLLDAEGNRLFGPEGMLVNGVVPMSTFTTTWSIAIDADNNVYLSFNGSGAGNPVYAHKISPQGEQLWGPNGINPGAGFDSKVLPLRDGGAIVAWLPGNQGVFQRFDANGNAVWAAPVTIQPIVANHRTSAGEMAELSDGSVVILYHDRGGFSPSSFFHAQRYDINGSPVWASQAVLANASTAFNQRYSIAQESDTVYIGYSAAVGLVFHSYLQRINPDGALPWGVNGSDFSTGAIYYERDTEMATTEGSPFIWAVCEYTSTSQGEIGEYIQKFDKSSGARLFGDNAKEVFPVNDQHFSHRGSLQLIDEQPIFMLSKGFNNGGTPVETIATYLDDNGNFIWPEQYRTLGSFASPKLRFGFMKPYNGQCVGVWVEDRPSVGSRAYAQNIQLMSCDMPVAGFQSEISEAQATFSSTAELADLVTWDFGDNTTGEGENAVHQYNADGVYTVCQFVSNSCGADTLCQPITIMITDANEPTATTSIGVYPNPATGDFFIKINQPENTQALLEILSAEGKMIYQNNIEIQSDTHLISIQNKNWSNGVYCIKITTRDTLMTTRMVISR